MNIVLEKKLEKLRTEVSSAVGKRIFHILACEEECAELGKMAGFGEKELFDLRVSAILHDITHLLTFEEHLEFCKKRGIIPHEEFIKSPPTIHSLTGSVYAVEKYPELASGEVAQAIASHTVGRPNMTLAEKILCLADYTEKTRKYPACRELRAWLWDNITVDNAEDIINEALYRYFINTENHIKESGGHLNLLMLEAKKDLENKINQKNK